MLILHIIVASLLIVSTLGLFAAAVSRYEAAIVRTATHSGLAGTFLSGGALVFMYGGLGKFCVTMSAVTVAVIAVDRFYVYRLQPAIVAARLRNR